MCIQQVSWAFVPTSMYCSKPKNYFHVLCQVIKSLLGILCQMKRTMVKEKEGGRLVSLVLVWLKTVLAVSNAFMHSLFTL